MKKTIVQVPETAKESNLLTGNNHCTSNASSASKSTSSLPAIYPEQGTFNSEESN
jgi:hypothetical protein